MAETHKIAIDGEWTLVDLYEFPRTYLQAYALLYALEPKQSADVERMEVTFSAFPWRGGYSAINFYNQLQSIIPRGQRPRLVSLQYGSPGWIELSVAVGVTIALRTLVSNFVKSTSQLHNLYHEIYKGLQERKLLRIKVRRKELALKKEELEFVDHSLKGLCRIMGVQNLDQIERLAGNRLRTLKIVLSLYRRIRTLAYYDRNGKAKL